MNHSNPDDSAKFHHTFHEMTDGLEPDPAPYDEPGTVQATGRKAGLNARGKVVLGAAGLALAGSGVIGYTIHTDNAAENANKAAELAIQQQRLDLERLQVTDRIDAQQAERQDAAEKSIQAKVESCVADNKEGSAYLQGVVDACKDQYGDTGSNSDVDMQTAGSSTSGGGISEGWLLAAGVGALGLVALVVKGRRTPDPYYGA